MTGETVEQFWVPLAVRRVSQRTSDEEKKRCQKRKNGVSSFSGGCLMTNTSSFAEVLQAIDQLPIEDQETLIEIVRRRLADQGRKRVVSDTEAALREFEQGQCRATTVDDLMDEILS